MITILRNLVFIAVFVYLLGVVLGLGVLGVYLGIVSGNILGGLVGYLWARAFIGRLLRVYGETPSQGADMGRAASAATSGEVTRDNPEQL